MILFLNVFITNQTMTAYNRGRFGPAPDRLDVFKYSIASFSVIPWSEKYIFCELDEPYLSRWGELESFIHERLPGTKLFPYRNLHQKQWQKSLEPVLASNDPLIWFFCNDDHIFIDYDLDLLTRVEGKLNQVRLKNPFCSSYVSHWPEMMAYMVKGESHRLHMNQLTKENPYYPKISEETEHFALGKWVNIDSVQIVSRELLHYWWFAHDYGDARLPRTDSFGGVEVKANFDAECLFPKRELVRHFDGYSHARIEINRCPPLQIPDGFFANQIRVLYGSSSKKAGFVTFNPSAENYSIVDPKGADYKNVIDDIPMFWKGRISEVLDLSDRSKDLMLRDRNEAILSMASARLGDWSVTELLNKFSYSLRISGDSLSLPSVIKNISERVSYPWNYTRSKRVLDSIKLSLVIIDLDNGNFEKWFEGFERFKAETEIVLVSVKPIFDKEWARSVNAKVDSFVISQQDALFKTGSYSIPCAMNQGLALAKGEIVFFCDTTQSYPPNFFSLLSSRVREAEFSEFSVGCSVGTKSGADKVYLGASRKSILARDGFDENCALIGKVGSIQRSFRSLKIEELPCLDISDIIKIDNEIVDLDIFELPKKINSEFQISESKSEYSLRVSIQPTFDELAVAIGLGKGYKLEQILNRLYQMSEYLTENLRDAIRNLASGNIQGVLTALESESNLETGEANLYACLLFRTGKIEEAHAILSAPEMLSEINVATFLLGFSVANHLGAKNLRNLQTLLEAYYPNYQILLS